MAAQRSQSFNNIELIDQESLSIAVLSETQTTSTVTTSGVILTPSTTHITRQTAKWINVVPNSNTSLSPASSSWRAWLRNPKIKSYYSRLHKDEAVLNEARMMTDKNNSANEYNSNEKSCHCYCWKYLQLSVDTAARLTLSVNFLLFFLKLAAAVQSGSLAVVSSLIDSTLDLLSGAVIAITSYLMRHYDPFHYPIGRTRLEPVAITITAAIMGTATLQIVTSSIEEIATGSANPNINFFSGTIIGLTIILKSILFLLCIQVDSPSVKALATDHRNDVASNIAALIFGLLGTYVLKVLDPLGALLLSFYIIINWVLVGREQLINLIGHRADRRFISKITFIAKEHDERIQKVDTVHAYTFGINYLVEVHIVLNPDTVLQLSHDIGESLQLKLETLKEVERAFVHCDFEYDHQPLSEHILPHTD